MSIISMLELLIHNIPCCVRVYVSEFIVKTHNYGILYLLHNFDFTLTLVLLPIASSLRVATEVELLAYGFLRAFVHIQIIWSGDGGDETYKICFT